MDNKKNEFLLLEYQTLREEIKETKSRMFKIINFSLTVVPTATLLGDKYQISFLIGAVPFVVMVVATLYLSENQALMRCGRYIKDKIEPNFSENSGWERWLADKKNQGRRNVDRFLSYSFLSLFFIYYVAASCIAIKYFKTEASLSVYLLFAFLYTIIGLRYLTYLWKNIEYCTNQKIEIPLLEKIN